MRVVWVWKCVGLQCSFGTSRRFWGWFLLVCVAGKVLENRPLGRSGVSRNCSRRLLLPVGKGSRPRRCVSEPCSFFVDVPRKKSHRRSVELYEAAQGSVRCDYEPCAKRQARRLADKSLALSVRSVIVDRRRDRRLETNPSSGTQPSVLMVTTYLRQATTQMRHGQSVDTVKYRNPPAIPDRNEGLLLFHFFSFFSLLNFV